VRTRFRLLYWRFILSNHPGAIHRTAGPFFGKPKLRKITWLLSVAERWPAVSRPSGSSICRPGMKRHRAESTPLLTAPRQTAMGAGVFCSTRKNSACKQQLVGFAAPQFSHKKVWAPFSYL
jgi:hypothetical protein